MTRELSEREKQLHEELIATSNKDDYFTLRKYPSLNEGVSGFLVALGMLMFLSFIVFLGGGIDGINLKLILFVLLGSIPMGILQGFYAVGSVVWAGFFFLSTIIAFFIVYGLSAFISI